jgi:uncharacterized protein YjiS (DUF1127 family)
MVLAFVVNAVVSAPAKFVALLIERHRTVRTIAQLEALPDRLLADIGIERPGHCERRAPEPQLKSRS